MYFISLVTFGMTSATMFYYTQVMMNMFKGYKDVNQVEDFWTVCLHTDRFLVEMFHNKAFKECISVENLKLWLLILMRTLF